MTEVKQESVVLPAIDSKPSFQILTQCLRPPTGRSDLQHRPVHQEGRRQCRLQVRLNNGFRYVGRLISLYLLQYELCLLFLNSRVIKNTLRRLSQVPAGAALSTRLASLLNRGNPNTKVFNTFYKETNIDRPATGRDHLYGEVACDCTSQTPHPLVDDARGSFTKTLILTIDGF